jgi:hypothetical protein
MCVLVLQWVNGSDPVFQRILAEWTVKANISAAPILNKFREWDELRFSLRSVLQHIDSWVNHIFIVTQHGQRPGWLRDHPRVHVVDLRSLVTDSGTDTHHVMTCSPHDDIVGFMCGCRSSFFGRSTLTHFTHCLSGQCMHLGI